MPPPAKIHLPVLSECALDEMNDENYDPKSEPVDSTLLKLPAQNLKGTFARAYKILTEICKQIGWDALLKYRSSVFVMEEEYRQEKHSSVVGLKDTDSTAGSVASKKSTDGAPPTPKANGSTEQAESEGQATPTEQSEAEGDDQKKSEEPVIEKPEETVAPEEVKSGSDDPKSEDLGKQPEKYERLQNKRLCERWLDNLFMVLYEVCHFYPVDPIIVTNRIRISEFTLFGAPNIRNTSNKQSLTRSLPRNGKFSVN